MRTRRIQYCYRQKVQRELKWHLAQNPWLCKGTLHTSTECRHAFLLLRVYTPVSLKNKRFKVALRILKKQCYRTTDMHVWKMYIMACLALPWRILVVRIYHFFVSNVLPIIFDGCCYCCECLEWQRWKPFSDTHLFTEKTLKLIAPNTKHRTFISQLYFN